MVRTDVSLRQAVEREYLYGSTRSEAKAYLLKRRLKFTVSEFLREWDRCVAMESRCEQTPLFMFFLLGGRRPQERPVDDAYAAWKGLRGPGKQLRDSIAAWNKEREKLCQN